MMQSKSFFFNSFNAKCVTKSEKLVHFLKKKANFVKYCNKTKKQRSKSKRAFFFFFSQTNNI